MPCTTIHVPTALPPASTIDARIFRIPRAKWSCMGLQYLPCVVWAGARAAPRGARVCAPSVLSGTCLLLPPPPQRSLLVQRLAGVLIAIALSRLSLARPVNGAPVGRWSVGLHSRLSFFTWLRALRRAFLAFGSSEALVHVAGPGSDGLAVGRAAQKRWRRGRKMALLGYSDPSCKTKRFQAFSFCLQRGALGLPGRGVRNVRLGPRAVGRSMHSAAAAALQKPRSNVAVPRAK